MSMKKLTHKQDGSTATVVASDYIVDSASEPARVGLKVAKTWPTDALRAINGVEVEFIAGYGPDPADVPEPIRQALLICIGHANKNRDGSSLRSEKVGESAISRFPPEKMPLPAQELLGTYKVWKI